MNVRRLALTSTAAAGGVLAALSFSSGTACADEWTIGPAMGFVGPELLSQSGHAPFDQTFLQQGLFTLANVSQQENYNVDGQLYTSESFGLINQDFVATDNFNFDIPDRSVVDVWNLGGGFENVYVDLAGLGPGGTNEITDTVVTPFGNFDIPTNIDISALDYSSSAAATPASAAEALPAAAATAYSILPDPGDGESTVMSVGGIAPLYTTIDYGGTFVVESSQYDGVVEGNADYYSDMFGMHNVLMQVVADNSSIPHGIIDDLSFGSGWENVYTDFVDSAGVAPNTITDTLITPFGDFNIPVAYDAVADFPTPLPAAATDLFGALSADWTTLVADFNAMF